jgi:hypothetical protein
MAFLMTSVAEKLKRGIQSNGENVGIKKISKLAS